MGLGGCDIGGELIRINKVDPNQSVYGSVPGFPLEKNCVLCRFFITGPGFLPGLVAHLNSVSYHLSECSKRYMRFEAEVNRLEDLCDECLKQDMPFTKKNELDHSCHFHEESAERADKMANDLHATVRLIDRCINLVKNSSCNNEEINLVPAGTITDVRYAFEEVTSEMHQVEILCQNSCLFPSINADKAILRRSQILDGMLSMNGLEPVLFKLSEDEQLAACNEMMKIIKARTGNLRGAVSVAEGKVFLAEIGLLEDTKNLLSGSTVIQVKLLSRKPYEIIE
jgi:hypothetical protein